MIHSLSFEYARSEHQVKYVNILALLSVFLCSFYIYYVCARAYILYTATTIF